MILVDNRFRIVILYFKKVLILLLFKENLDVIQSDIVNLFGNNNHNDYEKEFSE